MRLRIFSYRHDQRKNEALGCYYIYTHREKKQSQKNWTTLQP